MNLPRETLACAATTGAIFVRPCGAPAALRCAHCGCPLCRVHAGPAPADPPGAVLCPACRGEDRDSPVSDDDGTLRPVPASHSSAVAADADDAPFTDEDYAAFDAVSDYDKNADDGDGYDS